MAGNVFGRAEVRVNGELLFTKKGAKAAGIGGFEREPVVEDAYHGYTETMVAASLECPISDRDDVNLSALANAKDVTITFEHPGGKTYILRNAVSKGNIEMTAGTGDATLAFFGPAWEEQLE